MTGQGKSSLANYRARLEREGFVRVEINVPREDARLVRRVASALSDPARGQEARKFLLRGFAESAKINLKALLASAPFDGIDLDRDRDTGRDINL